jgi:hypothetical protein
VVRHIVIGILSVHDLLMRMWPDAAMGWKLTLRRNMNERPLSGRATWLGNVCLGRKRAQRPDEGECPLFGIVAREQTFR